MSEKTNNTISPWLIVAGIFVALEAFCYVASLPLIIPLILLLIGLHLYFSGIANVRRFVQMGFMLTLMMAAAHFVQQYTHWSLYSLPIAVVAMLTMLLFNSMRLSFMMAIVTSATVALVIGEDLGYTLIFFLSSLIGAYSVKGARVRFQLIRAGFFVGITQVISEFLLEPTIFSPHAINHVYIPLAISGIIAAGVILAFLKLFEMLFGEVTNFTLLELSDSINQPLLKRMALEAPGTYHHSLIVSNLSGAAADSIGANALLTRVGAYYHDIGKMVKPEYFTENQMMMTNKHDQLEPSMSRLVIVNHVKEGVELGKKHRLPPQIIDFIPQHHGTSLMHYFYQRALEEREDNEIVEEQDFRYPGPKPQTPETAIVLLADSVEGATRALDEHTPQKIDEVVRKIINNKFIDGQLDECDLSLKDIEAISNTFTRVLSATYHGRIKYPEKKNNEHQSKKPSAQEEDQPTQDQNDHPQDS